MTKHSHKPGENIAEETVTLLIVEERLSEDIRELIESSKSRFTLAANAALVILYWNVGTRINVKSLGMSVLSMEKVLHAQIYYT